MAQVNYSFVSNCARLTEVIITLVVGAFNLRILERIIIPVDAEKVSEDGDVAIKKKDKKKKKKGLTAKEKPEAFESPFDVPLENQKVGDYMYSLSCVFISLNGAIFFRTILKIYFIKLSTGSCFQ